MYLTAYETLACRAYNTKEIQNKLKMVQIEDGFSTLSTSDGSVVRTVLGVSPEDDLVPSFSHPFLFLSDDKVPAADGTIIIDTRGLLKRNRDGSIVLTNALEYRFQLTRAILNKHWITDPHDLFTLGDLAPLVFTRWLTDAIVRNLGVGPSDQVKITTIILFYWYSLFRNEEFDEKDKMRIVGKLSQLTSIPSNLAVEISDKITYMANVTAFTDALKHLVNNPRLEKINPGFLFALLGGSWFGNNVKEIIAVAIEHPPTFIAMVASALETPGYRKSTIGRLVYENDKRGKGDVFNKNLHAILKLYKGR